MKHILLFLVATFLLLSTFAQSWRAGEKQIIINVDNQEQASQVRQLNLNFDVYSSNKIRAYVVPKEISEIEAAGLSFKVEIEDLNAYSQNQMNTEEEWHTYQEIIDEADNLVATFPAICEKHIFGTSLGGRELAALKISDNVSVDENEAEIMFDGGIHGDEYCGAENLIRFAMDICNDYGTDPDITNLIDNREIWLYLMVNPDGRVNVIRYNNNGVDLNRDWMYMWNGEGSSTGPCSQVESKALRSCMYNNQFVVHTTYHGGTEYISLPWSYRSSQPTDWNHIYQLGGGYASTSTYPSMPYGQGNTGMYPINGSTKDSNYGAMGSISWSMEISNQKKPPTSQIQLYYDRNYPAMLAMIEYAGYGLEGTVTDAVSGDPVTALVFVEDYMQTFTDPTAGDYHKYVLPGTYSIKVMANGYETQTINNIVVSSNSSSVTNFELQPEDGQYVYKLASSQIPDNNEADEGNTMAVFGEPDNINYSIGKNGWIVLDMQYPVLDGPGFDVIVYEGDSSPEGYTCYAGETIDGPWISLGTGSGTTEFDISTSNLPETQYIKIMDDGDGSSNVADAGFDLDAIEALAPVSGVYIAMYEYVIDDSNGNNNGRVDPGETVDIIVDLKNNGDIMASGTIGTMSTTSAYISFDNNSVNFGDLGQAQSAEGVYTLTADAASPEGEAVAITLDVTANNSSYSNSFFLSFSIGLIVEDWETGNFEQFDWETGGNADWDISNEDPYEGSYCVKSGTINDNQQTSLIISYNVLSNGEIGFYKKVSSEGSYDYLKFYIDNNVMDQWSGESDWSEASYPVTTGLHTFKWAYEKDQSVSNGSDCAWVDFITLPSGAMNALYAGFTVDASTTCEGGTLNFSDASMGNVISWDWNFEGGTPATSTSQNPAVEYASEGSYDVSLSISDGTDTHTINMEDYIAVNAVPSQASIPSGDTSVNTGISPLIYEYETSGAENADAYSWELLPVDAGSVTGNGQTATVEFTDTWVGIATLKVKGVNDCGDGEFSDSLEIECDFEYGANENVLNEILIYPNPTSGLLNIDFGKHTGQLFDVSIINNLGETVMKLKNQSEETKFKLVNQEPGIYFIFVSNSNESFYEKLILK